MVQPTQWTLGKADVTGEETGECTLTATGVRVQASEEQICGDNAGKDLDPAGARSNLQGLAVSELMAE